MKELDEKGFAFLDSAGRPYLCAMWGGNPWLFYWHPDKKWVSLRQVSQFDIWKFPKNLTTEERDIYWEEHNQSLNIRQAQTAAPAS